ncbi:hypothetical protein PU629_09245 [Pullulanibacillus sp. KACC 23026]|uniref:hypothetical protein n=1 Tax=Pullulanibacillus sp. KACC 23026 TaxID=3028315 RepID=UPI0023AF6F28|nr:hypothetical protein [Pullulanibacillus sp. KACC 23026]WEG14521.1 hypothetical protein PU629_09245 [Pullulanibacillus sp. KACC 23026]
MKRYSRWLLVIVFLVLPTHAEAEEDYKVVSELPKERVTLYAKKMDGLYRDFKISFKGQSYSRPFWVNATNPTYAPELFYEDINHDRKKELIIALTEGTGSGVLDEKVHVYSYTNGLNEVLVENPLIIINKNVITHLTTEKAEIIVGDQVSIVDTKLINPSHLYETISFGSIIDYEVIHHHLMARVSGTIAPSAVIGDMIIVYEQRNNLYQAKSINFVTDLNKNPFYGPVNPSVITN